MLSFPASVQGGAGTAREPQHCPSEGQGREPHHCPRPQRRFPALRAMPRVPGPPGPSRARPHRGAERPQVRHRLPCRSGFLRTECPRPSPPRPSPQEPPPNTPTSPRPPVFYDFNWHSVQQLYDPHVCSNGTFIRRLRAYGSPGLRKRFNSHEPTQARPFTPAAAGHETCSVIKATSAPCSSRLQRGGRQARRGSEGAPGAARVNTHHPGPHTQDAAPGRAPPQGVRGPRYPQEGHRLVVSFHVAGEGCHCSVPAHLASWRVFRAHAAHACERAEACVGGGIARPHGGNTGAQCQE